MILYKYLPPERVDVLRDSRIRYTQLGALNDPFEGKPILTQIAAEDRIKKGLDEIFPEEIQKAYEGLTQEQKEAISYEVFFEKMLDHIEPQRRNISDFVHQQTPKIQEMFLRFSTLLGVLSLTENPSHLLMWSHYAQSHEGFVIGFDSKHEYFNQRQSEKDEFRHLRKVAYRQQRPQKALLDMDGEDVFLVKSLVWEYEQEWRIMRAIEHADLVMDPTATYPIGLFAYPPEALTQVILGSQIPNGCRQVIIDLLKDSANFLHVRLFQAEVSQAEFAIDVREISP